MTDSAQRRTFTLTLASLTVLLSSAVGCAAQERGADDLFRVPRVCIRNQMERRNVPSISVAVARDGAIVWEEAFGLVDIERGIEATPQTMYRLASISKVLTATGLMIQVERGRVDLAQPANFYLGDVQLRAYEGDGSEVTVERILHHTAGLPPYWANYWEDELELRPDLPEMIRRYGIVVQPPGERFIYTSNLGFGIIEYIIERVSGQPYAEYMRSEVFDPLGLDRTAVITAPYTENYIAREYNRDREVFPFYEMGARASSSVFSSAHDLVRFGMFHLKYPLADQAQILSDATIDLMQSSIDAASDYRLAWAVQERHGYQLVRHGGASTGVRTSLWLVPSEALVIVVLANGERAQTPVICDCIMAALLPEYASRMVYGGPSNASTGETSQHEIPVDSLVGAWEGELVTYEGRLPLRLNYEANGEAWMTVIGEASTAGAPVKSIGNPPSFSDGAFTARFPIRVHTGDAARYDHQMYVKLWFANGRLSGYALAEAQGYSYNLPSYLGFTKVR
jgi:CubicO group peptidase (beta-lactamase class C family)